MKNIGKLVEGIVVIVLGALMLVEGVVRYAADQSIFFEGTNPAFVVTVAVIAVVIGGSFVTESQKK